MKERFKTFLQAFPGILGEFWSAYFTIDHVQLNFLFIYFDRITCSLCYQKSCTKAMESVYKNYTKH